MKKLVSLILLCVLVLIALGNYSLIGSEPLNNVMQKIECQYPLRTTNPEGGCDNSDPCDPQSAAKGGSGECNDRVEPIPIPQNEETAMSHNIVINRFTEIVGK